MGVKASCPITCLNVMYKLMTAIVTEVLYHQAIEADTIPEQQRALIRGKRDCLDALHIDQKITMEAKQQPFSRLG